MTVEIQILSGSRQGERVTISASRFRIGADTGCEVRFDPRTDPGVAQRAVVFRLEEDGWLAEPLGREGIILDQEPLTGPRHVRSGQVLRMSAEGPDFLLQLQRGAGPSSAGVAPKPAWMVGALSPERAGRKPLGEEGRETPLSPSAMAALPPLATPDPLSAPASATGTPPAAVIGPPPLTAAVVPEALPPSYLFLAIGGLMALCAVLMVGLVVWVWSSRTPAPIVAETEPIATIDPPSASETRAVRTSRAMPEKPVPQPEPSAIDTPPALNAADLQPAIHLLQVELQQGGITTIWPVGTCCAIEAKTLITAGTVGCLVLQFLQEKGKVWAVQPQSGARLEVREARILDKFADHSQDATRRRFFDLALLEVESSAARTVPMADAVEIAALEDGMPLKILGYWYRVGKITRYDKFPLDDVDAKIFLVKTLPPQGPEAPRSLDVTARLKENSFGSPVFNAAGHLVGVFTESPASEDARAVRDLQHVVVIPPRLAQGWLRDRDTTTWIVPEVQLSPGEETARQP